MIADEQVAPIRHVFHAEHWKIGTIAAELHLHPDTVRAALLLALQKAPLRRQLFGGPNRLSWGAPFLERQLQGGNAQYSISQNDGKAKQLRLKRRAAGSRGSEE